MSRGQAAEGCGLVSHADPPGCFKHGEIVAQPALRDPASHCGARNVVRGGAWKAKGCRRKLHDKLSFLLLYQTAVPERPCRRRGGIASDSSKLPLFYSANMRDRTHGPVGVSQSAVERLATYTASRWWRSHVEKISFPSRNEVEWWSLHCETTAQVEVHDSDLQPGLGFGVAWHTGIHWT
jgi:hypothetical protein